MIESNRPDVKMRPALLRQLLALTILLAVVGQATRATPSIERLLRRQSGETEQESTTPKSQDVSQQTPSGSPSPRLYPDLARPSNFLPPFDAPPGTGYQQAPFVPFGMQVPPRNRLNADQQPAPFGRMPVQPRPMTAAERLQSQSFANGLGKRLLSMVGIDTDKSGAQAETDSASQRQQPPGGNGAGPESVMRALQNSSVLQQLNNGVHSIYGSLSKMYNSTVQDQLNLLQERFRSETSNTSHPWHQQVAQQVPAFFKQMAGRVEEAQGQLNRVWRELSQVNSSTLNRSSDQQRSLLAPIDQFLRDPNTGELFLNPFGASNNQDGAPNSPNKLRDFASRLRDMWHTQVEPELMMIQGQISRVWRDLIRNGAVTQESLIRTRQNNLVSSVNNSSSDLVDNILKEVDINGSEYSLVDPKGDSVPAGPKEAIVESGANINSMGGGRLQLSPEMQGRVVEMQRDINRLWMSLTNSLQGALANVKRTLNPRPQFETINTMDSSGKPVTADPAQTELGDKIKDLAKVQRDADLVHDALQQQQRDTQQRQSFGDRFRGLFNNVDMRNINQLPDRIGEQFNRFGNAVGNFWNRLPENWDNFMTNVRPPQSAQMADKFAVAASSTTDSPSQN